MPRRGWSSAPDGWVQIIRGPRPKSQWPRASAAPKLVVAQGGPQNRWPPGQRRGQPPEVRRSSKEEGGRHSGRIGGFGGGRHNRRPRSGTSEGVQKAQRAAQERPLGIHHGPRLIAVNQLTQNMCRMFFTLSGFHSKSALPWVLLARLYSVFTGGSILPKRLRRAVLLCTTSTGDVDGTPQLCAVDVDADSGSELSSHQMAMRGDPRLYVCQAPNAFMCVSSSVSTLGPFWVHFGSILGPFWVHFGSILGPFWVHFFRQESVFRQESMFGQEYSSDKNISLDCDWLLTTSNGHSW